MATQQPPTPLALALPNALSNLLSLRRRELQWPTLSCWLAARSAIYTTIARFRRRAYDNNSITQQSSSCDDHYHFFTSDSVPELFKNISRVRRVEPHTTVRRTAAEDPSSTAGCATLAFSAGAHATVEDTMTHCSSPIHPHHSSLHSIIYTWLYISAS